MTKTFINYFFNKPNMVSNEINGLESFNIILHQVIIGQLLGGGNVTRRSNTRNSYFRCGFGSKFEIYRNWVYEFFKDFTNKGLIIRNNKRRNSRYYISYEFQTKTLPVFNYYHSLFYFQTSGKYVKIVPENIRELMTPIVLAHLLMSSGHYNIANHNIEINTYNYSYNDCIRLANRVNTLDLLLYNISAVTVYKERIKNNKNQYYLSINGPAAKTVVRKLVYPHICKNILYRIGM